MPARLLAGLLGLTLVAAACGAASTSVQSGTVNVFFCTTVSMPDCSTNATPAQERAVGRMLRRIPNVTKTVFVSKAEALRRIKKTSPAIRTKSLPANPLPDKWVVTVDSDRNDAKVGKAICAAAYSGVQPCAAAGELGEVGGVTWAGSIADRILRRLR